MCKKEEVLLPPQLIPMLISLFKIPEFHEKQTDTQKTNIGFTSKSLIWVFFYLPCLYLT